MQKTNESPDNFPVFKKKLDEASRNIVIVSLAPGQFWDNCKDQVVSILKRQLSVQFILPDITQDDVLAVLTRRDISQNLDPNKNQDHLYHLERTKTDLFSLKKLYPEKLKITETRRDIFVFILQVDEDWIWVTHYNLAGKSKGSASIIIDKSHNLSQWKDYNESIVLLRREQQFSWISTESGALTAGPNVDRYIEQLRQKMESHILDFKEKFPEHGNLGNLISAFANGNGGSIFFGIGDEIPRQIFGITNPQFIESRHSGLEKKKVTRNQS